VGRINNNFFELTARLTANFIKQRIKLFYNNLIYNNIKIKKGCFKYIIRTWKPFIGFQLLINNYGAKKALAKFWRAESV
jgi:hypothetical protein